MFVLSRHLAVKEVPLYIFILIRTTMFVLYCLTIRLQYYTYIAT